jgi:hypothetical protein
MPIERRPNCVRTVPLFSSNDADRTTIKQRLNNTMEEQFFTQLNGSLTGHFEWDSPAFHLSLHPSPDAGTELQLVDISQTIGKHSTVSQATARSCRYWFSPEVKEQTDAAQIVKQACTKAGFQVIIRSSQDHRKGYQVVTLYCR